VFVALLVWLDLVVLHRKSHAITVREALGWTAFWIALALVFNVGVYFLYDGSVLPDLLPTGGLDGREAALQFFTGYVVEKSLSLDNIFVIAMIITNFHVPAEHQHRLLFWGILAAAVLRGVMILAGSALIARFDWIMYVFGVLLIASGLKMLFTRDDEIHPEGNLAIRLMRRMYPVSHHFHGSHFFAIENGRRVATPMLLALILIESSDVMFAIDSIPAVFAVTRDPFLVFTSNIFAILGLRSLYFALAGMMDRFRYLKLALVALLMYVGVKMLLLHHYKISNVVSLGIIGGILAAGIIASLIWGKRDPHPMESPLTHPEWSEEQEAPDSAVEG
jgi:tellurite resistance protein TerC